MLSFRKHVLTALALSLVAALPAFAEPLRTEEAPARSLEKYLPDSADGVIVINVRQLLDSELVKKAGLDKMLAKEDAKKAIDVIGFDPLKDVERIIVTSDKSEGSGKGDEPVFIFQGKFDPAKLQAVVEKAAEDKKEALKVHKTANGKVYELTKLDELIKVPPQLAGSGVNLKGKSLYFTFADKGHVVLTPAKATAETALEKAAGKKTTKLTNKDLVALLPKINPKQTIAVALPADSSEQNVKNITGGITVTSDVKIDFKVAATDADAAKKIDTQIGESLQQAQDILAALVALQAKEVKPAVDPAVDILKGIKHDTKESAVTVKADIKGETLEKLAKAVIELAAKQAGGGGGIK